MGKLYENPPLIEALCEFRFADSKEWDLTLPGLFYQEVKDKFPIKREQNAIEMLFELKEQKVPPGVRGKVTPQIQFFNKNETQLTQISPGILSVNQLEPYSKWSVFKPTILEVLQTYSNVASPSRIARIGLRFINRITMEKGVNTQSYLQYFPTLPKSIAQEPRNLLLRTELDFEEENGRLVFTLASTPSPTPKNKSFILDLDFITLDTSDITIENTHKWIETAHTIIETVFENSITNDLRVIFEEIKK